MNGRAAGAGAAKAGRGSPTPQRMSMCGLLSLQFYQPYFDVDTSEVKTRLLQAAWPLRKTSSTFLGDGESSQHADLYGPVWVSNRPSSSAPSDGSAGQSSRYLSAAVFTAFLFMSVECVQTTINKKRHAGSSSFRAFEHHIKQLLFAQTLRQLNLRNNRVCRVLFCFYRSILPSGLLALSTRI